MLKPPEFAAGALVFVVDTDEPKRVVPGSPLYSDIASLRLRTIPAALGLAALRPVYFVPPRLLSDPTMRDAAGSIHTIVVTKFTGNYILQHRRSIEGLIDWLSWAHGRVRLFADLTDNYAAIVAGSDSEFFRRYQEALGRHCTLTVTCEALREELMPVAQHGIHVIEDPYEYPQARPTRTHFGDRVRLCWFGALGAPNRETVAAGLASALKGLRGHTAELDLVTYAERRDMVADIGGQLASVHPALKTNFVPWSPDATWQAIDDADLVILPQEHDDRWGRVKSHNRLVETIWGGRIAIASPIPSYLELSEFAWVGENLAEGVDWALANPEDVVERVRAGQGYVAQRFAPERILSKWKGLLLDSRDYARSSAPASATGSAPYLRLNLGCGDKILPGYVNVDVAPARRGISPDVLCDLHELEPFDSESVDEVLAVHVVEHFWRWEVVSVLREWARVLKPGGQLILECPNLLSACEELLKNPTASAGPGPEGQRTMWVFYGDPAWKDPLMCHRWNYTPQSLGAIMIEAGLINVRQEPAQYKLREPRDMRMVGEKPAS